MVFLSAVARHSFANLSLDGLPITISIRQCFGSVRIFQFANVGKGLKCIYKSMEEYNVTFENEVVSVDGRSYICKIQVKFKI